MKFKIFISLILIKPIYATEINKCLNDNTAVATSVIDQLSNSANKAISELKPIHTLIGLLNFEELKLIASNSKDSKTFESINKIEIFLNKIKHLPNINKLKKVNDYFNGSFKYLDDQTIWAKVDHWATPLEFYRKQAGDCEDFAILKYFSLIYAGVPKEKLKISYVRIHNKYSSFKDESHMVLKYFNSPDEDPLILDTQISDIYPSQKRIDLKNVYDFDLSDIYTGKNSLGKSVDKISKWKDYLERTSLEGSID